MPSDLKKIHNIIRGLPPGNTAEVGVWDGDTFATLVRATEASTHRAYAFDSFIGMDEPGPKDSTFYPKGRQSAGGLDSFHETMSKRHGLISEQYEARAGFVPDCFVGVNETFVFIRIDLDHYEPTLCAAQWALHHLERGGVLNFDDFFFGKNIEAAAATVEFIRTTVVAWVKADVCFNINNLYLIRR
jgi:hypothetical protein